MFASARILSSSLRYLSVAAVSLVGSRDGRYIMNIYSPTSWWSPAISRFMDHSDVFSPVQTAISIINLHLLLPRFLLVAILPFTILLLISSVQPPLYVILLHPSIYLLYLFSFQTNDISIPKDVWDSIFSYHWVTVCFVRFHEMSVPWPVVFDSMTSFSFLNFCTVILQRFISVTRNIRSDAFL